MLNKIKTFINDNSYKIIVKDNLLYIENYNKLISLEDNYISIKVNNKKIKVTGNNLLLSKIYDNACLIKGTIVKIEVINE